MPAAFRRDPAHKNNRIGFGYQIRFLMALNEFYPELK